MQVRGYLDTPSHRHILLVEYLVAWMDMLLGCRLVYYWLGGWKVCQMVFRLGFLLALEWLDVVMDSLLALQLLALQLVFQLLDSLWVIWLELPSLVEELALELGLVGRLGKV